MEDKTFELLTQMYAEMQEMKSNMATKQDLARIENKMDSNFKALYDGYQLTYEKLNSHDAEIRLIKEHQGTSIG